MGLFIEMLGVFALITVIAGVFWLFYGLMLKPVRGGKNSRIVAVIMVGGNEPELERTVKGLSWLNKSGFTELEIVIADTGMDEETRRAAEIMERNGVRICTVRTS